MRGLTGGDEVVWVEGDGGAGTQGVDSDGACTGHCREQSNQNQNQTQISEKCSSKKKKMVAILTVGAQSVLDRSACRHNVLALGANGARLAIRVRSEPTRGVLELVGRAGFARRTDPVRSNGAVAGRVLGRRAHFARTALSVRRGRAGRLQKRDSGLARGASGADGVGGPRAAGGLELLGRASRAGGTRGVRVLSAQGGVVLTAWGADLADVADGVGLGLARGGEEFS